MLAALRAKTTYQAIRLDNESLCVASQNGSAFFSRKDFPYKLYSTGKTAAVPPEDPLAGPAETRGPGILPATEAAHSLTFGRDS